MHTNYSKSASRSAIRRLGRGAPLFGVALSVVLVLVSVAGASERDGLESAAGVTDTAAGARSADWWSRAGETIRDAEYALSWQEPTAFPDLQGAWQAPNRAHGLRLYFTASGLRAIARTDPTPSWELGLALHGWGRGEVALAAGPGEPSVEGHRATYDRLDLIERFVNSAEGLGHIITLLVPPEESDGASLDPAARRRDIRLVITMEGTLSAFPGPGDRAVDFVGAPGAGRIRYALIEASDARGEQVPTRLEPFIEGESRGVRFLLDDRDAVYPVRVQALLTSASWTVEGGQQGAAFGLVVATAGDVNGDGFSDVVVGAPVRRRRGGRGPRLRLPRFGVGTLPDGRLGGGDATQAGAHSGVGGARRATSTATATPT